MTVHDTAPLAVFTARATSDPFYIGYVVDAWRRQQPTDDNSLAAFLECDIDQLPRLCRCRRPRSDEPEFAMHIKQIAACVACRPDRLLEMVRRCEAVEALRASPDREGVGRTGSFLAARDRLPGDEDPDESIDPETP